MCHLQGLKHNTMCIGASGLKLSLFKRVCDMAPILLTERNNTALYYLRQTMDTILMNGIHLISADGVYKYIRKKYRLGIT
jgi:hypothetical protein